MNGVTIAVNSGYCICPDADYFVSDDWSCAHWSYMFNDLKNSKKTIALLYDKKLKNIAHWFGQRTVLFKHRKGWHLSDTYSHTEYNHHICQARNSLVTAIAIAHIMGCSPIILLGADCCRKDGKRYFWQFWEQKRQPYRNYGIPVDRYNKLPALQTDTDLLDILQYWNRFGKEVKKKCQILNASQISKIDIFPKIDLTKCLKRQQ